MTALEAKIKSTELKIIALGKAASEAEKELATIKVMAEKPTPTNRKAAKEMRMQAIADFYTKRKLKN